MIVILFKWIQVVALDFPVHLTVDEAVQRLLRQEYHRVAAQQGRYKTLLFFQMTIYQKFNIALKAQKDSYYHY